MNAPLVLLGIMFLEIGCSQKDADQPRSPGQLLNQSLPGRFQLTPTGTAVALDTKTGLLCKTFGSDDDDLPLCVNLAMNEYVTVNRILTENRVAKQPRPPNCSPGYGPEPGHCFANAEEEAAAFKALIKKYSGRNAKTSPRNKSEN